MNGAGKTTTFKILTGDLAPSSGSAFVMTNDVVRDKSAARKNLGYCPQFEGLLDHITGWQHLALFARLRGHHGAKLTAMVDDALDRLQLREYASRTVGKYSGGNRRKLSTAIAMLTEPEIIFLVSENCCCGNCCLATWRCNAQFASCAHVTLVIALPTIHHNITYVIISQLFVNSAD